MKMTINKLSVLGNVLDAEICYKELLESVITIKTGHSLQAEKEIKKLEDLEDEMAVVIEEIKLYYRTEGKLNDPIR